MVESLATHYPSYEVRFACRARDEPIKAQQAMPIIPGVKTAEVMATRFEVHTKVEDS